MRLVFKLKYYIVRAVLVRLPYWTPSCVHYLLLHTKSHSVANKMCVYAFAISLLNFLATKVFVDKYSTRMSIDDHNRVAWSDDEDACMVIGKQTSILLYINSARCVYVYMHVYNI